MLRVEISDEDTMFSLAVMGLGLACSLLMYWDREAGVVYCNDEMWMLRVRLSRQRDRTRNKAIRSSKSAREFSSKSD